jgi:hypothetical protein
MDWRMEALGGLFFVGFVILIIGIIRSGLPKWTIILIGAGISLMGISGWIASIINSG